MIRAYFPVPLCSVFCCLVHSLEVTLRASFFQGQVQQKRASVCLGKVLIKVYSDWTS